MVLGVWFGGLEHGCFDGERGGGFLMHWAFRLAVPMKAAKDGVQSDR